MSWSRQQMLLQQLGIQLWIPQQSLSMPNQSSRLWRDQPIDTSCPVLPHAVITADPALKFVPEHSIVESCLASNSSPQALLTEKIVPTQPIIEEKATISFNYTVLEHRNFVIVATVTDDKQNRLFTQLQHACQAKLLQLNWPLHIQNWLFLDQYVASYLNGFFASYQQRAIFFLGEFTEQHLVAQQTQITYFASLKKLITTAEHKQALWQALYPLIYDIE